MFALPRFSVLVAINTGIALVVALCLVPGLSVLVTRGPRAILGRRTDVRRSGANGGSPRRRTVLTGQFGRMAPLGPSARYGGLHPAHDFCDTRRPTIRIGRRSAAQAGARRSRGATAA